MFEVLRVGVRADVLETFTDADYQLGFGAMETTRGATARLAGARIVSLRAKVPGRLSSSTRRSRLSARG